MKHKSFTLVELLITVAILGLISLAAFAMFNPFQQIGKGWDTRRKNDLAILNKVLEDYYNDKGCYPKGSQICFDSPVNICTGVGVNRRINNQTCHICGSVGTSPSFSPYFTKLPCDPQHSAYDYLYQVEGDSSQSCSLSVEKACPTKYKIFSVFASIDDSQSISLGCLDKGCGPANPLPPTPTGPWGYDYGVTSPNITINGSTKFNCFNGTCQTCGTAESCKDPNQSPGCSGRTLYSSCQTCQRANGGNPNNCPPASDTGDF